MRGALDPGFETCGGSSGGEGSSAMAQTSKQARKRSMAAQTLPAQRALRCVQAQRCQRRGPIDVQAPAPVLIDAEIKCFVVRVQVFVDVVLVAKALSRSRFPVVRHIVRRGVARSRGWRTAAPRRVALAIRRPGCTRW